MSSCTLEKRLTTQNEEMLFVVDVGRCFVAFTTAGGRKGMEGRKREFSRIEVGEREEDWIGGTQKQREEWARWKKDRGRDREEKNG